MNTKHRYECDVEEYVKRMSARAYVIMRILAREVDGDEYACVRDARAGRERVRTDGMRVSRNVVYGSRVGVGGSGLVRYEACTNAELLMVLRRKGLAGVSEMMRRISELMLVRVQGRTAEMVRKIAMGIGV